MTTGIVPQLPPDQSPYGDLHLPPPVTPSAVVPACSGGDACDQGAAEPVQTQVGSTLAQLAKAHKRIEELAVENASLRARIAAALEQARQKS